MNACDLISLIVLPTFIKQDSGLASAGSSYISTIQETSLLETLSHFNLIQLKVKVVLPRFSNIKYYSQTLGLAESDILILNTELNKLGPMERQVLISPYLESTHLSEDFFNPETSTLDDTTYLGILDSVNSLNQLLNTKLNKIHNILKSLPLTEVTKLEEAKKIILLSESIPHQFMWTLFSSKIALLRHEWELLLAAHVLLDTCLNYNIEPANGWIQKDPYLNATKLAVTNPFLYLIFDQIHDKPSSFPSLFYTPRKLLLSCDKNHFCLKYRTEGNNWNLNTPSTIKEESIVRTSTPLRNSPDLYGVRFNGSNELAKTYTSLYLKSNLGSFEKESTTGLQTDFWLELNEGQEINNNLEISFFVRLLFPNIPDCISFRYLTSLGGSSSNLFFMEEEKIIIKSEENKGSVNGLRIIDGLSHFIADLRLFLPLKAIEIENKYIGANITQIDTNFVFCTSSMLKMQDVQSFFLSIY